MPEQSIALALFVEPFKAAAAEGAVLELKMRLLAGSIPALQEYALDPKLEGIETKLVEHFDSSLSDEERNTLRLCRQLRNKVLHADFRAAREKLNELKIETLPSQVKRVEIPNVSAAAIAKKIEKLKAGTEGTIVAESLSTAQGTIYGWFMELGNAGDFQKATVAFKGAATIVDQLADITKAPPPDTVQQ